MVLSRSTEPTARLSLLVATVPTGHRMDEWAGVLNLDFTAAVRPDATSSEFAAGELVENLRAAR